MKKPFIAALALFCSISAIAQPNSPVPKNLRAANTLDNLFDANGLGISDNLYGIPLEPGRIVGNAYLTPDWKRTTFMLYDADKMIEGYPSRYEIDQDQFEIKAASGIKVLTGKRVRSFVWVDSLSKIPHYFVNGHDLRTPENVPLAGFYEVITEGPFTLLATSEVIVKKATYNEKLDMGIRDQRIEKKTVYCYAVDGKVTELPSSKKKFFAVFGDRANAIGEFVRVNSLSLNETRHLKAIFEHYNQQVAMN